MPIAITAKRTAASPEAAHCDSARSAASVIAAVPAFALAFAMAVSLGGCARSEPSASGRAPPETRASTAVAAGHAAAGHAAASATTAAVETSKTPKLELVGGDFPQLVVDENDNPKDANGFMIVKPGQDPCKRVRAKMPAEIGGGWAAAIDGLDLSCHYEADDAGLQTVTKARLRKNAATLFGVPVVEVRLDVAERGYSRIYVLQGTMTQHAKALIAAIQARCRAEAPGGDCKAEANPEEESSTEGYTLWRGTADSIWLRQDENDPQRIVYAESPPE